jgi:hypothetical protein
VSSVVVIFGVPDQLLDLLRVSAGLDGECDGGVAQVVDPAARHEAARSGAPDPRRRVSRPTASRAADHTGAKRGRAERLARARIRASARIGVVGGFCSAGKRARDSNPC